MKNCPSGIFALDVVLLLERLEGIISESDGKLCGVGIKRCVVCPSLDDIWDLFFIFFGKPVGRTFCWCSFKVVEISRLFLILFEDLSHKV